MELVKERFDDKKGCRRREPIIVLPIKFFQLWSYKLGVYLVCLIKCSFKWRSKYFIWKLRCPTAQNSPKLHFRFINSFIQPSRVGSLLKAKNFKISKYFVTEATQFCVTAGSTLIKISAIKGVMSGTTYVVSFYLPKSCFGILISYFGF